MRHKLTLEGYEPLHNKQRQYINKETGDIISVRKFQSMATKTELPSTASKPKRPDEAEKERKRELREQVRAARDKAKSEAKAEKKAIKDVIDAENREYARLARNRKARERRARDKYLKRRIALSYMKELETGKYKRYGYSLDQWMKSSEVAESLKKYKEHEKKAMMYENTWDEYDIDYNDSWVDYDLSEIY